MLRFSLSLLIFTLAGITALLPLGVALLLATGDLPNPALLRETRLQIPLRIYSREGSLIAEYGEARRIPIKLEELPPLLIQAVIASEDARFYSHRGVDPRSVARAALHNMRAGRIIEGAGTITMQVARNYLLGKERTYARKLREAILAIRIEQQFSKEEILEMYLNKIYFGSSAYGVAAAAEIFFGRPVAQLDLAEIALLVGLPQNPTRNNPHRNPRHSRKRRGYVLQRMLTLGYIDRESYAVAQAAPLPPRYQPVTGLQAPYPAEWARQELQRIYGENLYVSGYHVYTTISDSVQTAATQALRRGLLEYSLRHATPLAEQHYALPPTAGEAEWRGVLARHHELGGLYPALVTAPVGPQVELYLRGIGKIYLEKSAFENFAPDRPRRGDLIRVKEHKDGGWEPAQLPKVEGSLTAMDPRTGATLAMIGGFDFRRSAFNRVTQSHRQPGSSFKPFIYSAALESGLQPASPINDAPLIFHEHKQRGEPWRPYNYDRKFHGPTTLREALVHSRNIISVRLVERMGMPFTKTYLSRFGFQPEQLPQTPTMALGNVSISPWELLRGYSVFANGGFLVEPYLIERVEDQSRKVLWRHTPRRACPECPTSTARFGRGVGIRVSGDSEDATLPSGIAPRVISQENAWIISNLTQDVIRRGTGRRARSLGRGDLSGKTGTTNNLRDAWFVGFNAELAAAAWVGFDDYSPLGKGETGSRAALPIWMYFMESVLRGRPETVQERPPRVIARRNGKNIEYYLAGDHENLPNTPPRAPRGESTLTPQDLVF